MCFRYYGRISEGEFRSTVAVPLGWFHVTFVFLGTEEGEGIVVYHNGTKVGEDSSFETAYRPSDPDAPFGDAVIGKDSVPGRYSSSVQVDEMLIFDAALSAEQAKAVYELY